MTFDLGSAAEHMAELVRAVPDAALDRPTPCADYDVATLLGHIRGLADGFTHAAAKTPAADGPPELPADWRASIPATLEGLATAWRAPDAWEGMTQAGGVDLPAEVAAAVAVEELTVHGWDLARAVGLPFSPDAADVDIALGVVTNFPQAFGTAVACDEAAPALDRAVALSGRDPGWATPAG